MPWLPIYAAEKDYSEILEHLNQSNEIAFIVSIGAGKWVAVDSIKEFNPGRHCIWHVPSGPLPLFKGVDEKSEQIINPFDGWKEIKAGANSSTPYFGAGHPGVIWLNVRSHQTDKLSGIITIGLSSFEWIGNHYKAIGSPANPETEKFWKSLGRWVKKQAIKVPRGGPEQNTQPEIWAFSNAISIFESGAKGGNI
jgi:hypothetical protein